MLRWGILHRLGCSRARWTVGAVACVLILSPAGTALGQFGQTYDGTWLHPAGMQVAPDGAHVYVTSVNGTLALARDEQSGGLTLVGSYPGARGGLEISPDGRSIYAAGGDRLLAYSRAPGSGTLSAIPVDLGGVSPGALEDIAVSPDGRYVYVADSRRASIYVFARATDTGALRLTGAVNQEQLDEVSGLAAAPGGQRLYAASRRGVSTYTRTADGSLSLSHCCFGIGGSEKSLLVDADEARIFSGPVGPLVEFRDPDSGELSIGRSDMPVSAGGGEVAGSSMALAGDGILYAVDRWKHRLYQMAPTPDGIEVAGVYRETPGGPEGVHDPRSVAVSPDGRHLYLAAGSEWSGPAGTVAGFARAAGSGDLTFLSLFRGPPPAWSSYPPSPPPLVQIDSGAAYTNSRKVTITLTGGYGQGSLLGEVQLSNDGGFGRARIFPRAPSRYSWLLDSTGPERLSKAVYVREGSATGGAFSGGPIAADDIILDEADPRVLATRRTRGGRRLQVRAVDGLSGVSRVQLALKGRRHGGWKVYRPRAGYRVRRSKVRVRVRDRAGNVSRWRAVRAVGGRVPRQR